MGRRKGTRVDITMRIEEDRLATLRRLAEQRSTWSHPVTYAELVREAIEAWLVVQLDGPLLSRGPQRSLPMFVCPPIRGERCE